MRAFTLVSWCLLVGLLFPKGVLGQECDAQISQLKEQVDEKIRQLAASSEVHIKLQQQLDAAKQAMKQKDETIARLEAERAAASGQCDASGPTEVSVLGVAANAGTVAGEALQGLLDQTDVDEQVAQHYTSVFEAAKGVVQQISSTSFNDVAEAVRNHDVYKTHLAAHVDKVAQNAEPYVSAYVNPAVEAAKGYADQARVAVSPHIDTATKALDDSQLIPMATQLINDAPAHASTYVAKIEELLDPVFAAYEKGVKKIGITIKMPKSTTDRILVLVVSLLVMHYVICVISLWVLKKVVRLALTSTRIGLFTCVVVPLKISLKLLRSAFFVATCGKCCGLCRSKQKVTKDPKKKTSQQPTKPALTVDEVTRVLDISKDKQKAAELLATRAKKWERIRWQKLRQLGREVKRQTY